MSDDVASILDIVLACRRIARFVADSDEESFFHDERTHWAVVSQFALIGEAATRLSTEFRDQHHLVPWSKIVGMRNRVVHGYDKIDWHLVWMTANRDIPQLLQLLAPLMQSNDQMN
jgi:uncharacterized protein with HEPN domain